jgi:hypothetical protein
MQDHKRIEAVALLILAFYLHAYVIVITHSIPRRSIKTGHR